MFQRLISLLILLLIVSSCRRSTEQVVFTAIGRGDVQYIKRYLADGGSPDVRLCESSNGKGCRFAIHCAAAFGNVEICRMLIAYGADVNALDEANNTPLLKTIDGYDQSDDKDSLYNVCKYLIPLTDLKRNNLLGWNVLHMAARAADQRTINLFANVKDLDELMTSKDEDGNTPVVYMNRRGLSPPFK
ncbi:MAG: ankyrin repeat domain-containing protein [Verrucomicrobiota bacterium]